jgi:hypothetical protein
MNNNNSTSLRLVLMSLLVPFGILLSYLSSDIYQVYLGIMLCGIGGFCFGVYLAKIKHRFIEIDDMRRFVLVYVKVINIMVYIVAIHFFLGDKNILALAFLSISFLTSYMYKWLKK